ncbi:hypothetical protein D3C72_1434870 [compost metagenome]
MLGLKVFSNARMKRPSSVVTVVASVWPEAGSIRETVEPAPTSSMLAATRKEGPKGSTRPEREVVAGSFRGALVEQPSRRPAARMGMSGWLRMA